MRYVIWGGKSAENTVYRFKRDYNIEFDFIVDSYMDGAVCDIDIKKPCEIDLKTFYVIVTCNTGSVYFEIKRQLETFGLKEFKNYIWHQLFGKKMVLINANCHGEYLASFLERQIGFRRYYAIYPLPAIQLNTNKEIDIRVIENADIYIHQDIRSQNQFGYKLSDEYVVPKLKKNAIDITIPNFVGLAKILFPYTTGEQYVANGVLVQWRDSSLDSAIYESNFASVQDINEKWNGMGADSRLIKDNFNHYKEAILHREKNWDIKLSGWIFDNFTKIKMFYDPNHPSLELMNRICIEVCKMLNVEIEMVCKDICIGVETVVSPQVKKVLGIQWDDSTLRINNKYEFLDKRYPSWRIDDFIREYVWCFYRKIV